MAPAQAAAVARPPRLDVGPDARLDREHQTPPHRPRRRRLWRWTVHTGRGRAWSRTTAVPVRARLAVATTARLATGYVVRDRLQSPPSLAFDRQPRKEAAA